MYNFALAFFICAAIYVIGEVISTATKAWVPSVFVSAAIILVGYWTVLPHDLVTDAALMPFGSTICVYLLIVHMGSIISFKQLKAEWKTIVVCLAGLAGMCGFALVICPLIMDRSFIIAGLPPLTGGIPAATIMMQAAEDAGLEEAAVFAVSMYCVQGFAGYPLTALCLKMEGKKMLQDFRSGAVEAIAGSADGNQATEEKSRKKLLPALPKKINTPVMIMCKLGVLSWIAVMLGGVTIPIINMKISGALWALIVGLIATSIGFLDEDAMNKCNSYGIAVFGVMMYILSGLNKCTPQMLLSIIGPMISLIVIGVAGMGVLCFVVSKILKKSFWMSFATALTALYGFPPNAIITENTCTAMAETPEEMKYLMDEMLPKMIVGGFTTVTITSVIIAGVFAGML